MINKQAWFRIIIAMAGCLFQGALLADGPAPEAAAPMTLAELVDQALQNHPETALAWWSARRAAAAKDTALSAYYPQISCKGHVAHGREYQFTNGEIVNYTNIAMGLSISYLLFDCGERHADSRAARAALLAASWQSSWTIQRVLFDLLSAAYSYCEARELLESQRAVWRDSEVALKTVEELFSSGLKAISDVYAVKATFMEAKMRLIDQEASVAIAYSDLLLTAGLQSESTLNLAPLADPPQERVHLLERAALQNAAERLRADLMSKYAKLDEMRALRSSTRAHYQPKVTLGGDLGGKRYVNDKANGFNYNILVNLSFPIYTGGEAVSKQRGADADLMSAAWELEIYRLGIAKEIATYSERFNASQEMFELSKKYLQNAEYAFTAIFERYRSGSHSIFDLTSAQRQLAEARLQQARLKMGWYRNLAQLAFSVGVFADRGEGVYN